MRGLAARGFLALVLCSHEIMRDRLDELEEHLLNVTLDLSLASIEASRSEQSSSSNMRSCQPLRPRV